MPGLGVDLCHPSQCQASHFLLILKIHFVLIYLGGGVVLFRFVFCRRVT